MSYREILRKREAIQASLPRREYITKAEYAKLKSALTRAKNSGDPQKVLTAVEAAVKVFDSKIWPDDWAMWRIALEDAAHDARQLAFDERDLDEGRRLMALCDELHAASIILFP